MWAGVNGWGIGWWLNDLMMPELWVIRGVQYTFIVERGDNPIHLVNYHPFYITDEPVGGYQHKSND